MSKNKLDKAVTVRFYTNDYNKLLQLAEQQNVPVAEVIRRAWKANQEQKDISIKLLALEERLSKRNFEIVSAVANLDEQEKNLAEQRLKNNLKGGF